MDTMGSFNMMFRHGGANNRAGNHEALADLGEHSSAGARSSVGRSTTSGDLTMPARHSSAGGNDKQDLRMGEGLTAEVLTQTTCAVDPNSKEAKDGPKLGREAKKVLQNEDGTVTEIIETTVINQETLAVRPAVTLSQIQIGYIGCQGVPDAAAPPSNNTADVTTVEGMQDPEKFEEMEDEKEDEENLEKEHDKKSKEGKDKGGKDKGGKAKGGKDKGGKDKGGKDKGGKEGKRKEGPITRKLKGVHKECNTFFNRVVKVTACLALDNVGNQRQCKTEKALVECFHDLNHNPKKYTKPLDVAKIENRAPCNFMNANLLASL